MAIVLKNYYLVHKLNTIGAIIDRYVEANNKEAKENKVRYKYFVAEQLGIRIDHPFNVLSKLPELMKAMICYENGGNPYPEHMFALAGFMGE